MKKYLHLQASKTARARGDRQSSGRLDEQSMTELLARGPLDQTFARLGAHRDGLTIEEATERRLVHGANEVARGGPPSWLRQLLQAFSSPFAIVLLVLAAVSYLMGVYYADPGTEDYAGFSILLIMVLVSGLLRFFQEFRSQRAADKLKAMVRTRAAVQRRVGVQPDGTPSVERRDVAVCDLVPGDVVHLQAGDIVPADMRLIDSRDLLMGQAALTGESLPIEKYDTLGALASKRAHPGDASNAGASKRLLDLPNVCFMGTTVVSGSAKALVIATGARTYFGSLAGKVLDQKRTETSFDKGVNSVTWLLIRFMLVMVPMV
ncbi:MAG: cation-transporting P-type ATPase, partial [Janthinobacterium lividum]